MPQLSCSTQHVCTCNWVALLCCSGAFKDIIDLREFGSAPVEESVKFSSGCEAATQHVRCAKLSFRTG